MTQVSENDSKVVEVAKPVASASDQAQIVEHRIAYEVRKHGSIGMFFWRSVTVRSASRLGAEELAARMIEVKGYERRGGPIHLNEVTDKHRPPSSMMDAVSYMKLEDLKSGRLEL